MQIDILTTFPNMFRTPFQESMVNRACEKGFVQIAVHNLRDWTKDSHRSTDDRPYGGGPGMIMMIEPIDRALQSLSVKKNTSKQKIILTSAKGSLYTQQIAKKWSKNLERIVLICGHYEGVDERVAQYLVDEEIRVGDYVLTGGELPAMLIVDSVARLIPGVLGDGESLQEESHSVKGYFEYPQYTRPEIYKTWKTPNVLLSGNHHKIEKWRKSKANMR